MHRPVNRTVMYLLIVTLVAAMAAAVNSVWYADRVARESNRNWCALVTTLDDAYQSQPPRSPTGLQVAAEVHALRVRLGCP